MLLLSLSDFFLTPLVLQSKVANHGNRYSYLPLFCSNMLSVQYNHKSKLPLITITGSAVVPPLPHILSFILVLLRMNIPLETG